MKYIDKIYCINLDHRTDRWNESLLEFKKLGIENEVERVSAFHMSPGIAGCTWSHLECIKLAKKNNFKNVLILEDDILFNTEIFFDTLNNTFEQLNSKSLIYDILYLGANLYGHENQLIDKNLAKIVAAKAGHAYIINSTVYDFIISSYENINWSDTFNWYHGNPNRMNIDYWYRNIQLMGNSYGVYPAIADQRPGYSDLLQYNIEYNLINLYNNILNKTNE